jgi:hypothetical protein
MTHNKLTEAEKTARAKVYATVSKDDKMIEARNYKHIWLEPPEDSAYDERSWCHDDAWGNGVKYVRDDIAREMAEALRKRITHGTNCRRIYDPDLTCDCGYEDGKKALAEYRGEANVPLPVAETIEGKVV